MEIKNITVGCKTRKADGCTVGKLPSGKLSYAGCHPDYEEGSSYSDADYTRDQRLLNDLWWNRLFRLRMFWLLPLSHEQVVSLSQSSFLSPVDLTDGRGEGMDGVGAKSYDREKA